MTALCTCMGKAPGVARDKLCASKGAWLVLNVPVLGLTLGALLQPSLLTDRHGHVHPTG